MNARNWQFVPSQRHCSPVSLCHWLAQEPGSARFVPGSVRSLGACGLRMCQAGPAVIYCSLARALAGDRAHGVTLMLPLWSREPRALPGLVPAGAEMSFRVHHRHRLISSGAGSSKWWFDGQRTNLTPNQKTSAHRHLLLVIFSAAQPVSCSESLG